MKNEDRTRRQLLDELKEMRRRISELENREEERSEAMEALREREQLNRALTGQSLVGVFLYQGGRVIFLNEAAAKMIGYSVDEVLSPEFGGLQEFIHPQDLPLLMEQAAKKERGEKDSLPRYSCRVMTKSGEVRWIEVFSQPLRYRGGNAICGVIIDITERKQAEEALRESHELLSAIESTAVEGLIITDRDCNVLWHNKQVRGAKGDVVGEKCCRVFHGRESRCPFCVHPEIYADGEVREYESVVETQAGPGRTVWVRAAPIRDASGEIVAVLEASRDITEHKQAEDALSESEERFRVMFDNSHDLMTISDTDARTVWANAAWRRTLGYTPETQGDHFEKIHPDDRERIITTWRDFAERDEVTNVVYRYMTAWGDYVTLETTARMLSVSGKSFVSVIAHDITERKKAEVALRASERQYRLLAENATDVIWTMDMNLRLTYVSPSITRLTGHSVEEAKTLTLGEILTPASVEIAERAFADELAVDPMGAKDRSRTLELEQCRKDGSTVWTEVRMTFLRDADGRPVGILGVSRDITDRRRMEEDLLRAQKLESLGILAGGIAHDFNNLLGAILANISLAERHAEPGTMAFERLAEARKAALRARNLTQQLLTFSKGGEPVKRTASVAELLRDCAGFALQESNVQCDLHIPGDLWPVEIDEGQMYQVFNNLIINADEAMQEGGKITVEAVNATVGRGSSLSLPTGKYVRVSITDQGVGISHENISRIFDPYFSTKRNGIGLGLAVAHAIVKKHDGHISVESELGIGTAFHIHLPAFDKQPLTGGEEALTTPRGEGRILLVEDEDVMREAAAAVLDDLGYKVVLAKDGAQAVSAYKDARESGNPFDLVIMDLTMPGESGGKEAMEKLLEIDPDIRAIASSGYSDDPIMAAYKEYGFGAALAKPYDVDEMAAVVQEMMKTTA